MIAHPMTRHDSTPFWKESRPKGELVLVDRGRYVILPRGCRDALLVLLLTFVVAGLVLVLARQVWLAALGHFLIYSESPRQADAIVVLAGGDGARSSRGSELYRAGYAPLVITSSGGVCQEAAPAYGLRRSGVPEEAIRPMGNLSTTYEEAQASLALLEELGARQILLVTDTFHSRRARDIFVRVYADAGIAVTSVPAEPAWFDPDAWWREERSAQVVFNEYAKYVWFWLGQHG
jgi:uncharacterized SAM-binding protein YcdF (DUF218 family)